MEQPDFELTKHAIARGIRDLRSIVKDDREVAAILAELHKEEKETPDPGEEIAYLIDKGIVPPGWGDQDPETELREAEQRYGH